MGELTAGWGGCFFVVLPCFKKGEALKVSAKYLLFAALSAFLCSSVLSFAQSPASVVDPVARVRQLKSWEYGPFVNYGVGVGERASFKFLSAGFQLGKPLSRVLKAGPLSGQFEYAGNLMPLWQAYTPAPHYQTMKCGGVSCTLPFNGGTYRGVSLTPVILRWNIQTGSRRIQPWFQAAGGLLYTTRQFPPSFISGSEYTIGNETYFAGSGSTSVWNFMPQGGVGAHYFLSPQRSIDLGVNAVHISSASLGDKNPGVNASLQFQLGYTYWK